MPKKIHKNFRCKYLNLNPIAPTIRGLVKVQKEGVLIRPIINRRNAPAYKLTKMLSKKTASLYPTSVYVQRKEYNPNNE
jgi:hypothetical protein